ncbi:hypothetical protein FH972_021875 [Carpinus fangiana]|uniref:RNA polymerase II transcription factor B subunit 2 n=1 Tax=Carpinus fangiana TaxID=176857 RepID=A0A5N6KQL6_9ROSI|nr:hypothetical protein FH972_021875 [Carpinus fangiana]
MKYTQAVGVHSFNVHFEFDTPWTSCGHSKLQGISSGLGYLQYLHLPSTQLSGQDGSRIGVQTFERVAWSQASIKCSFSSSSHLLPARMATQSRGTAFDYLEQLPGSDRGRLYQSPSTALAIFRRMLSHLAKTIVMSMLYMSDPVPAAALELWVRPESREKLALALDLLIRLNIMLKTRDTYTLEKRFAKSLRLALTGGGDHMSFGVPSSTGDDNRVDVIFLDEIARMQWENILYYIVGSAGANNRAQITKGSEALLEQGGLIEMRNKHARITQKGFTFLLQEVNTQIWTLLVVYLKNADKAQLNMEHIEMLSFIFTLGSMELGQDYSTETLTDTQQRMLEDLNDLGLVYRHPEDDARYYPTRLAATLNSDFSALGSFTAEGTSTGSNEKGFIVVETNYRIYAYTSSPLRIQILSLFTKLNVRYPNMVAGRLTKESIQSAIALGITSDQILNYLTAYAHPVMASNPRATNSSDNAQQQGKPALPPTVVDQIRLWQIEGDRMKATAGFLFKDFKSRADYEDASNFAETINVRVWKSDAKRSFFVTRHEQVARDLSAAGAKSWRPDATPSLFSRREQTDARSAGSITRAMDVSQRPTVAELHGDNVFSKLAHKHWLGKSRPPKKPTQTLLKELCGQLQEDGFSVSSLLLLENLQLLELYLWPTYNPDATYEHVLLTVLLLNAKRRENLPSWTLLTDRPSEFSSLFRRLTALLYDQHVAFDVRTHLLVAIIGAFQSLDNGLVRKECAPLVSVGIWQHLHSDTVRQRLLERTSQFKKAWRAAGRRFDAADDDAKARIRFERSWLYTLLMDFIDILYSRERQSPTAKAYCERFLEFVTDLQSQFPTRRYFNTLLQDLNIVVAIHRSPLFNDEDCGLLRDFLALLRHYTLFPFDDHSGLQLSSAESSELHRSRLAHLQRTAIRNFKDKLSLLTLANYGALGLRSELQGHLDALREDELFSFATQLGFRTQYPDKISLQPSKPFVVDVLLTAYEHRPSYRDVVRGTSILPTERTIYEPSFLRSEHYDGSRPVALPKLNLQYLTVGDFLWRSFILFRCDTFYQVRTDMEDTVKRLKARRDFTNNMTRFDGSSRLAIPIQKPGIVEIVAPSVGEDIPAQVKAEVVIHVGNLSQPIRSEWESLRPGDVVFLLAVHPEEKSKSLMNGHADGSSVAIAPFKYLRVAEIVQVQDDKGRPLRAQSGISSRSRQVRLLVNLDTHAYHQDTKSKSAGQSDVYESLNVVVRRRSRENNFKPMLESIQRLVLSDVPMPAWLQDVFLGLGDPAGATYKQMSNALRSIDFRDTFLDWQHLKESLPDKALEGVPSGPLDPPYVLEDAIEEGSADGAASKKRRRDTGGAATDEQKVVPSGSKAPSKTAKSSKKRRRSEAEEDAAPIESVKVSTYQAANTGPYPSDAPKTNAVRFTPAQVEAIASGTQPGLTVIVGPPGTGKTDVATQIINNIYHNFPQERTLLIAHSNQALNQLFQKIIALDIDERHLLRLGHGEGELQLNNDASYSKHGRVESFLENGARLLGEVDRLAASLDAPGAHGSSCETAEYFSKVYVQPAWTRYWDEVSVEGADVVQVVQEFPFYTYFANAPQPLFPEGVSKDVALEIALGCHTHIARIFAELDDIRPFEILRQSRDKQNYLLVSEARIIAMTSTHAAMKRAEIAALGFHYDSIVMEEAAQITEIEAFIPLAMQKAVNGQLNLKRVIMCGDHLQNSPVVQNQAFRQYANLEQSMFQRLVRLGVPTTLLDKQGRARPSLSDLYRWRYPGLGDLPIVHSAPAYLAANAGLRHEYQFVNVPDYKGHGESEPSPHFIQNLGEAEYLVALYMFMRLLGYPAQSISILATYAGQRALIKDVLTHRCAKNKLFGLPRIVTTVDKYQGEQNDYVLLSLTRTSRPGYLRDIRRLTVALSRARLGLYIFGRREVFESVPELKPSFDMLLQRPDKLELVTGEMFSATDEQSKRQVGDEVKEVATMEGVEHLGQYVFEMTQAKIKNLKEGTEVLPPQEAIVPRDDDEDDDVVAVGEAIEADEIDEEGDGDEEEVDE